jgi:hypothetical protein
MTGDRYRDVLACERRLDRAYDEQSAASIVCPNGTIVATFDRAFCAAALRVSPPGGDVTVERCCDRCELILNARDVTRASVLRAEIVLCPACTKGIDPTGRKVRRGEPTPFTANSSGQT